ncbi:eCIS core domain-containing protein [Streptomyces melanogenes]|uniref:DUF4157 domain-containing protein n=1 Tax=Streptomyces melanogenes TaxID=67326 RepID=A0ABZ1XDQ7_9ACTN|nr:DUF4157 domain-containing protein [Streptomyces melanogenes]
MRAHDEEPGQKAANTASAPPRSVAGPAASGAGQLTPAQVVALRGLVGNHAVARRVATDRHVHGDGCGHGVVEDTSPEGQLALIGAAMTSSAGRPLPSEVREEAEPFYKKNFSTTRLHDDAVAQRATAAMGAQAMTIGNHIFLPPSAVRNKKLIGHELSHVKNNLDGVVETGHDNGAGVPVTHPGQGSERSAEGDGDAYEAGETHAPSLGAGRASSGSGPGSGVPALQRMVGHATVARAKDTKSKKESSGKSNDRASKSKDGSGEAKGSKGKAKAEASGSSKVVAEWEARYNKIAELARQCTDEQPDFRWGRVTQEVIIRYARSYKGQPDEQSLRHLARTAYSGIGHQEKKAAGAGASAGTDPEKKQKKDKEEEVQAMLGNNTLFFSSNRDQSVLGLHRALLAAAGLDSDEEDAPGAALQQMLITDYDNPAEVDDEQEAVPEGSSKRRAGAPAPQTGKRRQTGKGAGAAALPKYDDPKERDRQARLKIRQGLTAKTMPAMSLDSAMDVDESASSYKRDNATLQALRNVKWVRTVDVSKAAAQDPTHRAYLVDLVSGKYAGYAYLLHNGDSKDAQHAEQKLLMLLSHAGKDAGQFLIHGRKRPCRACLALLAYSKDELGFDISFDPRGNHLFVTPLKHAYESFGDGLGPEEQEAFDAHFEKRMGPGQPMYASAPRNATPAAPSAAHGIHEAVMGDDGGMEQRLELTRTDNGKLRYPNKGEQPTVDTPSTSEASDESGTEGVADLTTRTRELNLRTEPKAPPAPAGDKKARAEQDKERLRQEVERQLMPLMGPALLEEYQQRRSRKEKQPEGEKGEGKPYVTPFPDALLERIQTLTAGGGAIASQAFVAKEVLDVQPPAIGRRLKKLASGQRRKKPRQINGQEKQRLIDAMPDEFRQAWDHSTQILGAPEFSSDFELLVFTILFLGPEKVSQNSMADALHLHPSTLKGRLTGMKERYGHLLDDADEGPGPA